MSETPEELAAVEQLLAESDALHGWLTRLDRAPVSAPDRVRDRVRLDYQHRLDQITAGLRAHAAVLGSKLERDREEHEQLSARATAAREALAEAQLRHAVGEYDDARFDSERVRHSSDIESYELGLGAVSERIARLTEIHALVDRPPRSAGDDVGVAAEAAEEPPPPMHVIEEVDAELVAIADLAPDADPDDVLAIFDEDGHHAQRAARGHHAPPAEAGPLSFRPSGAAPDASRPAPPARPRPFEGAPPLGIPGADVSPRFIRPGERIRPPAPPAAVVQPVIEAVTPPENEVFGEEIVASGSTAEPATAPASRTLRCSECGAMNRPLEWYCEKCGAELTAA